MFTGLIEQVGAIGGWEQAGKMRRLTIRHRAWEGDEGLCVGDSVAVSGACLTVETVAANGFVCVVLDETVARTSLAGKGAGEHVNLERAMSATARFGGHMVQGHVDALGHVRDIRQSGGDRVVRIACPDGVMSGIVEKGSVAVDGISLTVVGCGDDWFEVHVIPHSWANTTLADLAAGDAVNIETDIIGKYVRRYLDAAAGGSVTEDKIRSSGSWGA